MNTRKELYALIDRIPAGKLKFAKTALENILQGRIYRPNTQVIPVYDMSNPEHMKKLLGKPNSVNADDIEYLEV